MSKDLRPSPSTNLFEHREGACNLNTSNTLNRRINRICETRKHTSSGINMILFYSIWSTILRIRVNYSGRSTRFLSQSDFISSGNQTGSCFPINIPEDSPISYKSNSILEGDVHLRKLLEVFDSSIVTINWESSKRSIC